METPALEEILRELARESGRTLGELGVRSTDQKWIREHAETIASLAGQKRRGLRGLRSYFSARRAARTER